MTTESAIRASSRIYVRVPVEIAVDSHGTTTSYAASTLDFSSLGARVQTDSPLAPGARVNVIWTGPEPRSVPSQVVWSAPANLDRGHQAGLRFLEPLPARF
jgi:hypothetical protein